MGKRKWTPELTPVPISHFPFPISYFRRQPSHTNFFAGSVTVQFFVTSSWVI
jgi:hypothetical protein